MAENFLERLRTLNRSVAVIIGGLLLICAMVVLADIVLRQLGHSFGGTDEISGYVMAIATSWGMAYALLELGHVRIDLMRTRLVARGRSLLDVLAMLALNATISVIAWRCWPVLERSINNSSRANTPLETPLALVQTPWFLGWVWFAIMSWLVFGAAVSLILQGKFNQAEAAIGSMAEADNLS